MEAATETNNSTQASNCSGSVEGEGESKVHGGKAGRHTVSGGLKRRQRFSVQGKDRWDVCRGKGRKKT